MNKERNELIDSLKGFAILLVILGHAVQYNLPNSFDNHPLFRFIYSFHMPLFMFLSGYVSCISFKGSNKQLISRLRTLLLPFCSWFLFSYFFNWATHFNKQQQLPDFSLELILLLRSPDRGLWFLWVLFFNYLFLYLSIKITKKHPVIILLVFFILINTLNTFFHPIAGMASTGWHLLFFIAGYAVKQYNVIETKFFNKLCYLSLLLFPVAIYFWHRNNSLQLSTLLKNGIDIQNIINYAYGLFVPTTGILMSFTIIQTVNRLSKYFKKFFLYTGKISLELYTTHFYFFSLLFLINSIEINFRIMITFTIVLLLTIITQRFIKTSKLASFIFYGKKR